MDCRRSKHVGFATRETETIRSKKNPVKKGACWAVSDAFTKGHKKHTVFRSKVGFALVTA